MKQPMRSEPTVKPRPASAQAESLPQALLRAVDGSAVVAEQKPADRRHCDDGADIAHVGPLRTRLNHPRSPSLSRIDAGCLSPCASPPAVHENCKRRV